MIHPRSLAIAIAVALACLAGGSEVQARKVTTTIVTASHSTSYYRGGYGYDDDVGGYDYDDAYYAGYEEWYDYGSPSCTLIFCGYCGGRYPLEHLFHHHHSGYLIHTPRYGDVFYPIHLVVRLDGIFAGRWGWYFWGGEVYRYRFGYGRYGTPVALDAFYRTGHHLLHPHHRGSWRHGTWRWRGTRYDRQEHEVHWRGRRHDRPHRQLRWRGQR